MQILHVLNHSLPHVDGYSMRSHNILVHQQQSGLEVMGLTSPKHGTSVGQTETIDGIPYYRIQAQRTNWRIQSLPFIQEWLLMYRLQARLLSLALTERVSLIHAHSPVLNGIPALRVARRLKIPIIYEMRALWEEAATDHSRHGLGALKYRSSRWLETRLLHSADVITTICQGLKNEIATRGIPVDKIHVFPNGVDTAQFAPCPINQNLKGQLGLNGRFVLGFIGSFYAWEGLDLLLRAMERVVPLQPTLHVLLVGADQQEAHLKQLCQTLHLVDHVTFVGRVPQSLVRDYYSIMDLCVYPRRKARLTDLVTPIKPLEAMSMTKLVLASDVGGHKELITDGLNGFLFAADNQDDLARKIIDIAANAENFAQVCQNARLSILASRNWPDIIKGYGKLYGSFAT